MSANDPLPEEAWLSALLSLPGVGPSRLRQLLGEGGAEEAWRRICEGRPLGVVSAGADVVGRWRTSARALSVADRWAAMKSLGIEVAAHGSAEYPKRLLDDVEPPVILYSMGQPLADVPTVAIVGTRTCSSYGQRCAFELGSGLVDAGVSVVSGLALGIDAAAHQGALSSSAQHAARPLGVVGSGLDVIYPKKNAALWADVASRGTLLSEAPPGVGPERWRFPARNRIIAGLSDAVIVVESHERGGSLLTVDEAQLRDRPVGAIPGPITSRAAAGSNRLLVDGATPILDVSDVLALIGHTAPRGLSMAPDDGHNALLEVLGWTAMSFEQICREISAPASDVAIELEMLVSQGLCVRSGSWIERVR